MDAVPEPSEQILRCLNLSIAFEETEQYLETAKKLLNSPSKKQREFSEKVALDAYILAANSFNNTMLFYSALTVGNICNAKECIGNTAERVYKL